jgi:hypothetical protein
MLAKAVDVVDHAWKTSDFNRNKGGRGAAVSGVRAARP